jgi:hypothetical protein
MDNPSCQTIPAFSRHAAKFFIIPILCSQNEQVMFFQNGINRFAFLLEKLSAW